tara:strand:- start:444 stop:668 length:225 start_codon:yes stop_codon:yes gene_type:complete
MNRAFKKNDYVKYIFPGIPFIETKTDSIRWFYGVVISTGKTKHGAELVYIRDNFTEEIVRVSSLGVFDDEKAKN